MQPGVTLRQDGIESVDEQGHRVRLAWADLHRVFVMAVGSERHRALRWVLESQGGPTLTIADATVAGAGILAALQRLDAFDNSAVVLALHNPEWGLFVCWQRERSPYSM